MIGYNDLKGVIQLPSTFDLTYLARFKTKDGTSWSDLVRSIGAALVLFNRSLTQDYLANYITITTDLTKEYGVGGESDELQVITDLMRPDPVLGGSTGHMLPMVDYGGALGWSYLAMRRGKSQKFIDDITNLIARARNTWERKILTRMFSMSADTVGSAGKSVPFADGGTADSNYIPQSFGGNIFDATHDHYTRQTADSAGRVAFLAAAFRSLREHGHKPPYELVIPDKSADVAAWAGEDEFVPPSRAAILTQGVETRSVVNPDGYLGVVETAEGWAYIKPMARLATSYAGMFKASGFRSASAPLAVRYEEGYPLGLALVSESMQFPLADAIAMFTFGVGVNERTAGYLCKFGASGDYTDPVIS